ncbi:gluconokinase [Actinomadura sp. WAC 06369]|uniref:gluconokinase n=1 Tax=Actinomadura sp. WAC 06369 TaxID=2203193 RepID=UPI000F7877AC|nr:gluconokinase [Actinomadura sp. WAC 06369]RSN57712.1 carbohydrate kinase [Actinomadura sp. WAC 06369]
MTNDVKPPEIIVVGGVSGSGKTTVGTLLAERLGWDYAEADDFHSPENIAKMRSGVPLTDADRMPWLRAIGTWMDGRIRTGEPGVVTCSALKRAYRDILLEGRADRVRLVLLDGDRDTIAARMRERKGHFFKADLLDSQFADYERPGPGEDVLTVPADDTPEAIVDRIRAAAGR